MSKILTDARCGSDFGATCSMGVRVEDPLEEGMATLLQFSCLENPVDRGAWQAIVYRVTKSQT